MVVTVMGLCSPVTGTNPIDSHPPPPAVQGMGQPVQAWVMWVTQKVAVEAVDPVFQAKMLDMHAQADAGRLGVGTIHVSLHHST